MAPRKRREPSLAEKISGIVGEAPKPFGSDDDEADETRARVDEYEDADEDDGQLEGFRSAFNASSIRRRNVGLLADVDVRYKGRKVSQKELFNKDASSEESEETDSEDLDDGDDDSNHNAENNSLDQDSSDEENLRSESENEYDENNWISAEDENNHCSNNDESKENDEKGSIDSNDDDDSDDRDGDEGYDDCDESNESVDLSNPLRRDRGPKAGGIKTISGMNVRSEIEKGNCVRNQLQIWENLLEMRIQLQRCLVNSNKMPQYDSFEHFNANKEFKKHCNSTKDSLHALLSNLINLQSKLMSKFPETRSISSLSAKRKTNQSKEEDKNEYNSMDEEISSDFEDAANGDENEATSVETDEGESNDKENAREPPKKRMKLSDAEKLIARNHQAYAEYRNSVIKKWNDKVRLQSGAVKKGPNQPVLQQIEFALANRDRLLQKTRLKRSEYAVLGRPASAGPEADVGDDGRRMQEHDSEIYDDDDFYHKLLQDLIEYKSSDVTDPIQLSRQWSQLQSMRRKMKRKIDTRATKGRRLRYDVHPKLVNFMAPIRLADGWTDHAKDELYGSLFGRVNSAASPTGTAERPEPNTTA